MKETEEEEISPRLPLFATLSHSFARGSLLLLEPLLLLAGEVCLKGDKRSCDAATSDLHIPLPLAKKKKTTTMAVLTDVTVLHGPYVRPEPAVRLRDGALHLLVQLVKLHGEGREAVHLQIRRDKRL